MKRSALAALTATGLAAALALFALLTFVSSMDAFFMAWRLATRADRIERCPARRATGAI